MKKQKELGRESENLFFDPPLKVSRVRGGKKRDALVTGGLVARKTADHQHRQERQNVMHLVWVQSCQWCVFTSMFVSSVYVVPGYDA